MADQLVSFFEKPAVLKALYCGNLLWHTSAFYHFSFRGPYMMRKLSTRSRSKIPAISGTAAGDEWHYDIMAYLGYINVGYAVLAGLRLRALSSPASNSTKEQDLLAMTILALANGSQAWGNFVRSRGSGRWIMGNGWDRITVLDALFLVLDTLAALAHVSKN